MDIRQLKQALDALGYTPVRHPHGPGTSQRRGIDPNDDDSVAQKLIMRTAFRMSEGLLPVAELSPTDTVTAFQINVGAGATVGQSIQWPSNGVAVAIRATTSDGLAASMAGTFLQVQVDGSEELFPAASGNGPGFIPFAMISGTAAFLARYAFRREFQQATQWQINVQNTTGGAIIATVAFDIVRTSNLRTGSNLW
jgi:hypothetical protein